MKKASGISYEDDSEDETIPLGQRKRRWMQKRNIESDDDSPSIECDVYQRTKKMPSQAISELLQTQMKPRFDSLDYSAKQIKQKISDNYLQTTKNATTIVKSTSKVAKLVEENKEEIRKVFNAVDTEHQSVKGKLDRIAKSSDDTYNKLLEKNERQAYVIAKLNADKERLQTKLDEKEQIILDRGLGNARVVSRIMVIESTTQENLEKTDALSAKYDDVKTKLDAVMAILRTLVE